MPARRDLVSGNRDRLRADRDRAGLRVRLRRLPGAEGVARGRLPHDRRQLESGHDHDRSRLRRSDVHRAAGYRGCGRRPPARASRCSAADARWSDWRLNLAVALAEHGILDELGVELIGAPTDDPARGGPRALPGRRPGCGLRVPASRIVTSLDDSTGCSRPLVVRPAFTLGRHGASSPTTPPSSEIRVRPASRRARSARCSSRSRCAAGTSSSSRRSGRNDNVVIVCSIENLARWVCTATR